MALFDVRCEDCKLIIEDIYAESASRLQEECPECGRQMAWVPFVRTQSTKAPFFCQQAGRKFHNYSELDRWAKDNGKSIVPTKEYERTFLKRKSTEERFVENAKKDATIKEKVKETHYRLKHGYRFHQETQAEYRKKHKE